MRGVITSARPAWKYMAVAASTPCTGSNRNAEGSASGYLEKVVDIGCCLRKLAMTVAGEQVSQ